MFSNFINWVIIWLKNSSNLLWLFVLIVISEIYFLQADPLSELAAQLHSLSSIAPKRYLLHEYLKSKGTYLGQACHNSDGEPEIIKDLSAYQNLLGEGLKFKDIGIHQKIFAGSSYEHNVMGNFTPWDYNIPVAKGKIGDFSVLVDCDERLNIYQLRVLTQKESDCSLHTVKNLLWLIAALKTNKDQFANHYINMLNPMTYKDFLISAGCPLNPPEAYRHILDIYTKANFKNTLPGLPKNSDKYIRNIIELAAMSKTATAIGSIPKGKQIIKRYSIQSDIAKITSAILSIETDLKYEQINSIMNKIILLLGSDKFKYPIEILPALFDKVHESDNYLLGIYLLVSTGAPAHATGLIINKYNNNIEYLFCDPLNWPFTRRGRWFHDYKTALRTIVEFVNNPELLKEALIRYLYAKAFNKDDITKVIRQMLDSKVYDARLYHEKYKEPFCKLIRSSLPKELSEETYELLCR